MAKQEIVQRNLISTIDECMQEHEVVLAEGESTVSRFLIEVTAQSSPAKDFTDTYKGDVDKFRKKLAEKLLGKEPTIQTYGVLVTPELAFDFAFNRKFADLDREGNRIVFKNPEELLLEMSEGQDLSPQGSIPDTYMDSPSSDSGEMVFKYSLTGKKGGKKKANGKTVQFERASLLDRVKSAYDDAKVMVFTTAKRPKRFYLMEVPYKTSTFQDFLRTYDGEVDKFKKDLAKTLFGEDKKDNTYGILMDPNFRMRFAFNTAFANYDPETRQVVYTPLQELLLNESNERDMAAELARRSQSTRTSGVRRRRRGGMLMKYALAGKKEE
ncbi:hypothetical protein ACFL96_10690 [Thermoproteota archaeon]